VDPQTVLSYLEIEPDDPFDPDLLDNSLKALFRDRSVCRRGGAS